NRTRDAAEVDRGGRREAAAADHDQRAAGRTSRERVHGRDGWDRHLLVVVVGVGGDAAGRVGDLGQVAGRVVGVAGDLAQGVLGPRDLLIRRVVLVRGEAAIGVSDFGQVVGRRVGPGGGVVVAVLVRGDQAGGVARPALHRPVGRRLLQKPAGRAEG